ncbi:MAG: hypothetical protein ACYDA9_19775 [Terriglobia bacterium]
MAETFLRRTPRRSGGTSSSGTAPDFPPTELVFQVKALAFELSTTQGLPLSRWSTSDLAQHVSRSGLVAQISGSTNWRRLHEDAIRPWQH